LQDNPKWVFSKCKKEMNRKKYRRLKGVIPELPAAFRNTVFLNAGSL